MANKFEGITLGNALNAVAALRSGTDIELEDFLDEAIEVAEFAVENTNSGRSSSGGSRGKGRSKSGGSSRGSSRKRGSGSRRFSKRGEGLSDPDHPNRDDEVTPGQVDRILADTDMDEDDVWDLTKGEAHDIIEENK